MGGGIKRSMRTVLAGSLVLGGSLTALVIGTAMPASASAVTASIPIGNEPVGVSSDGTHVWVANSADDTVTEINASNGTVIGPPIKVGSGPDSISSDGIHVWVANCAAGTVTEINASNGTVIGPPISVGNGPNSISSDGTDVWVNNQSSQTLSEIDISSLKVTTITPPPVSRPNAVSTDGTHAWVAEGINGSVDEYDSSSGNFVKNIPLGVAGPAIAISSDGTDVWVASGGSAGTVSEIDASTDKVIGSNNLNTSLTDISSDGSNVWVTSYYGDIVGEINARSGALEPTIPGGAGNGDLAGVSSDGTHVWVANDLQVVGQSHVIEITPDPTTSLLVPSNGKTVSGSTYLDASATNATSVKFLLFGGSYGYNAPVLCTATTSTAYGWLCSWNTSTVPNGTYVLKSVATGPGGTTYGSGVTVTVNNPLPPPTTNLLVPASAATMSGSTYLDASATNATSVEFRLFGGVYGYTPAVLCTATTSTAYGWLCSWNTTTVPDGSYTLLSEAFGSGGSAFSSSGVRVTVDN